MEKLFKEMTALYKLDQIAVDGTVKMRFEGLPLTSVILLSSIGAVWVGIAVTFVAGMAARRKKAKK